MEKGCEEFSASAALKDTDEDRFEAVRPTMRKDGRFIEAIENNNLIVQRLQTNPDAFGIFGFSFMEENQDSMIEGVAVDVRLHAERACRRHPRSLREFVGEHTSDCTWGLEGYLAEIGLIPLNDEEREDERNQDLTMLEIDRF